MLTLTNTNTGQTVDIADGSESLPIGFLRENGNYRIEYESEDNRDISLLISDEEIPPAFKEVTPRKTRITNF